MPLEPNDIQALATALKNLPESQVNATAVKLPHFWPGNPEVWFRQVESIFSTRNPAITTQQTKFDYVIQSLDNSSADRVQNIILNPPGEPYDKIKSALIAAFGKSQAQKDQELLNLNGLGDRKPSELLQHMKNMNADPETLFKALFMAQLPHDIRRILASSTKTDLGDLAAEADKIVEVSRLGDSNLVNATAAGTGVHVGPGHEDNSVNAVSRRPNFTAAGARNRDGTTRRSKTPRGPAMEDWMTLPGLCKYHSRFGANARKCIQPCKFGSTPIPENWQSGRK